MSGPYGGSDSYGSKGLGKGKCYGGSDSYGSKGSKGLGGDGGSDSYSSKGMHGQAAFHIQRVRTLRAEAVVAAAALAAATDRIRMLEADGIICRETIWMLEADRITSRNMIETMGNRIDELEALLSKEIDRDLELGP